MSKGLDVIIVDDNPQVCELIADMVNNFYTWGDVFVFTDVEEATLYCMNKETSIAIFIVDVFLKGQTGFIFLDTIAEKFISIYDDTVMITGHADDNVVNTCIASNINHLLEKPVRSYALQFAIRAIASKYLNFMKKLKEDPGFCKECQIFL